MQTPRLDSAAYDRRQLQRHVIRTAASMAPVCVAVFGAGDAAAAYGPFLHGEGIYSLGFGGVGVVAAQDTYALAANPALAPSLGSRFDIGVDWAQVFPKTHFRGNLLGADHTSSSRFRHVVIPQGGFSQTLNEQFTIGVTGFAAGFGTDYKDSPFQRFGGPERAGAAISLAGISNVLAWQPVDDHALAIGVNLSYQIAELQGLQPFRLLSEDPEHVTDNGKDGALGAGFSLGWNAHLTPWLEAGAAYRSKTWAQRFKKYAGVFPEQGRLEFPARYGAAVALRPWPTWTLALETQRVLFASEKATGNGIEQLQQGEQLGADDGPGFGWRNQTVYKLGIAWDCTPLFSLRGGYSRGTDILPARQTLIASLAPATIAEHYTFGLSYEFRSGWQVDSYIAYAPRRTERGDGSVPIYVGGGEADVQNGQQDFGLSVGRQF